MKEYDFSIVASSVRDLNADGVCEIANKLYEYGADDCTVSSRGNSLIISFDRESNSFSEAVISAIKQTRQIKDLKVKSVDAGQYVGLSDAAELSDMTRSAMSKFSTGERGDGTFPTPYLRVTGKTPLYDWAEIAEWLCNKELVQPEVVEIAKYTATINFALKLQGAALEAVSKVSKQLEDI